MTLALLAQCSAKGQTLASG